MNRTFLLNVIFLIAVNLIIKPFYIFGIDRVVQNEVGKETYGLYFALLNFTFIFQIISDFGLQNYNSRNISQHPHLISKYFSNLVVLKIMLAVLYFILLFPAAFAFQYSIEVLPLIALLAFNQVLIGGLMYLRSNITGLGFYKKDSMLSAFDKLLMIVICGSLLYVFPTKDNFRIEWFIVAQTASLLISSSVAYLVIRKFILPIQLKFNKIHILLILKESWPFAMILFLMTAYTKVDGVMLERLLINGKAEAGIYASGYRLLDAVNMTGFLFAGLLLPMFTKMLKDNISILPLLTLSALMLFSISLGVGIVMWFFKEEIAMLLYTEATPYWGEVLGYLMLSFIAVSSNYIFGTLLTANNDLHKMNTIFALGLALNVLFNFFLIPYMGAKGAAISTLATQSFVALSLIYLAKKEFHLSVNTIALGRIFFYIIGVWLFSHWIYDYPLLDWKWKFLIAGLFSFSFSLLTGMIQPRNLKKVAV